MISKKAKYALKALKVLAQNFEKGPVLISFIADSENIPKKFLEAILLELRNHGILQSQKGKGGGYYLRIPPDQVTFAKIIRIDRFLHLHNRHIFHKNAMRRIRQEQ